MAEKSKAPGPPQPGLTPEQMESAAKANAEVQKKFEPADWEAILQKVKNSCGEGALVNGAVFVCKKVVNINCAGPNPDRKARMPRAKADEINKEQGTRVSFDQIATWEGGQAVEGYVPWWPTGVSVNEGVIGADTTPATRGGKILKGSSGAGVTIGSGTDLGGQKSKQYLERLKNAGASPELLDKLKPYIGLRRAEACKYLREHPLKISKEEADLIDKDMKSNHLKYTMSDYKDNVKDIKNGKEFKDLSDEEQTVLMSRHYQDGNITESKASVGISRDMANGETQKAADKLTATNYPGSAHATRVPEERVYLESSIPKPKS